MKQIFNQEGKWSSEKVASEIDDLRGCKEENRSLTVAKKQNSPIKLTAASQSRCDDCWYFVLDQCRGSGVTWWSMTNHYPLMRRRNLKWNWNSSQRFVIRQFWYSIQDDTHLICDIRWKKQDSLSAFRRSTLCVLTQICPLFLLLQRTSLLPKYGRPWPLDGQTNTFFRLTRRNITRAILVRFRLAWGRLKLAKNEAVIE